MTRQQLMLTGFVIAAAVAAGCSSQYNGAWGFLDPQDRQTLDQAREYHAQKQFADDQARASDSDDALASTKPASNPGAGQNLTAPPRDAATPRPEFVAHTEHGPLGLFGQLPDSTAATQSPLDSPQGVEQVTFSTEGADFDPEIDPTGKFLAFASTRHRENADIYLQRIGGTTVTQLTNDPGKDIMPTFSPDGSRIAFASDRAGNWDIYIMDVNGGKAQQVTNNPTHDLHPGFSPDGKTLVFCSYGARSGQWELVVIELDNPANRRIIAHGLFPQFSPRGDKILFQRARERGTRWFSVWTVDFENGEARRATEVIAANNAATITPAWSPDGRHIVFSSVVTNDLIEGGAPTQADVWIVAADGSGRTNLTGNKFANLQPVWAKDGSIFFVSNRGKDAAENIWSIRPDQALQLAQPPDAAGDHTADRSEKGTPSAAVETNN